MRLARVEVEDFRGIATNDWRKRLHAGPSRAIIRRAKGALVRGGVG